jgi:hypothetical protein
VALEEEIRLQTLDGGWETLLVDRYSGDIHPDSLVATSNEWGPETITFVIRGRPLEIPQADLSAFTPCEYWVGGICVWDGRVKETPTTEGADPQILVSGVGWQAQLDDDQTGYGYVHNDMTQWVDPRSAVATDLNLFRAGGQVNTEAGGITCLFPQGYAFSGGVNNAVGVMIDLGADSARWAKRLTAKLQPVSLNSAWSWFIRGFDTPAAINGTGSFENALTIANPVSDTYACTFASSRRYVTIFVNFNTTAGSLGNDQGFRLSDVKVFSQVAYEAGFLSNLRTSTAIKDVIDRGSPLLQSPTIYSNDYATEQLADLPLARWKMDESFGVAPIPMVDSSGNNRNGAYGSGSLAPAIGQAGGVDQEPALLSVLFDGVNDYASAALDLSAYKTIVVELLLFPVATGTDVLAFEFTANAGITNGGFYLDLKTGTSTTIAAQSRGSGGSLRSYSFGAPIPDGTWHHILLCQDLTPSDNTQLVVDGVTRTRTQTVGSYTAGDLGNFANSTLYLASRGGATNFANVYMHMFAIYGGAPLTNSAEWIARRYEVARAKILSGNIRRTAFSIPLAFDPDPRTPREVITAYDAYHRWRPRVRPGRQFMYDPMPNAPLFKTGAWPGADFQDASAGSGEEIYNRALITGQQPDGTPLFVDRRSQSWDGAIAQPSNPSATVDNSGWSATGGDAITRDTTTFQSSPASFKVAHASATLTEQAMAYAGWPGAPPFTAVPVVPGRRYRATAWLKTAGAATAGLVLAFVDGGGNVLAMVDAVGQFRRPLPGTWAANPAAMTTSATFICQQFEAQPPAGTVGMQLIIYTTSIPNGGSIWWDEVTVEAAGGTLVDRRGFIKTKQLPLNFPNTPAGGNQLGDIFLSTHAKTPLKGTMTIAPTGLRGTSDENIHPSELLLNTLELLRLSDRIDPDTGAMGRDGIIRTVQYSADTETAVVTLDNDRQSLEALLARMSVVVTGR